MSLPSPNDKDISKLHAEVNQYINQRFLIGMAAITISGVVLGWIVAGTSLVTTGTGGPIGQREWLTVVFGFLGLLAAGTPFPLTFLNVRQSNRLRTTSGR